MDWEEDVDARTNDMVKEVAVVLTVSGKSDGGGVRELGAGFYGDPERAIPGMKFTRWGSGDDA